MARESSTYLVIVIVRSSYPLARAAFVLSICSTSAFFVPVSVVGFARMSSIFCGFHSAASFVMLVYISCISSDYSAVV